MHETVPTLISKKEKYLLSKNFILHQWLSYDTPKKILNLHVIEKEYFINKYASGVFDYFMGVISGEVEIGNCPVMQELMVYLKYREISADELFEICSHFRRSMIDFSYDAGMNSKKLFDEISYVFDKNFRGILKFYTDTIFQKLIDVRQEAVHASQAKEYFLSNMSHEIRTPLNAILGFVNLLLDDDISKKHRNYLDIIHNSGENLLSIINDILDFSKLRSGEFTLEYKSFSLHEELAHSMELFVASANAKNITITSFIDPKIPIDLYGDPLRIKQILSNFLSNAIKFTPESGVIKVESSFEDNRLKICVSDNGIGICEEDIDKIFTAFAQAQHSEHPNQGGTGLGLSICYQLAEKMGGSVSAISEFGKGSTFILELPIKAQTQESQFFQDIEEFRNLKMIVYSKDNRVNYKHNSFLRYAEIFKMNYEVRDDFDTEFDVGLFVHEELESEIENFILQSDKKFIAMMSKEHDIYNQKVNIQNMCFPLYCSKIHQVFYELLHPEENNKHINSITQKYQGHLLVAEDNEANQELIKIILTKYGLTFDIVENGLLAFESYKETHYDLILMDEQMPLMDGNIAAERIIEYEENNKLKHTPISALTANVIKGVKEQGLLSGYDAFLGKPIVLKELEKVFVLYLKQNQNFVENTEVAKEVLDKDTIVGLNVEKLTQELMLSEDELRMLLELFMKKMKKNLPELKEAIVNREYIKIAKLSHSIKGSSGNFRIKILQERSSAMEEMAKKENIQFEYEKNFDIIEAELSKIRIEQ